MAKVYLSPSNHGEGQNKCLRSGCYEDKHTRPIAEACAKYLNAAGIETKIGAKSKNMAARCKESDSFGADLYVPIHTNAAGASARYLLFMFYQDNDTYRKIFNAVAPKLVAIYPGNVVAHFDARPDLIEVKTPKAKTIYCELGFHTNQTDVDDFIHDPDKVGKALAEGICAYFGVSMKPEEPEAPETPAKKTISQIADEVIAGKWGNGTARKTKLEASGYDYDAVQAEVNKKLGATSKPAVLGKGSAVTLKNCPLFASSTAGKSAGKVTGIYYLWDGKILNGRYRITNAKNRVGVAGQVTGWINAEDI